MQVQVISRAKDLGADVRRWAEERVFRQLERFELQLDRVVVRLADANGPQRGGLDKRVALSLSAGPRGRFHLVGTATTYEAALNDALHRLKERILHSPRIGSRRYRRQRILDAL